MNDKLLSFLGIARRAGRLALGFDMATESMNKGKSKLLFLANDLSPRTMKSITETAKRSDTQTIVLNISMEHIGMSIGKVTGIISVNDEGFAEKLKKLYGE